jgi:putative thioredoxin
MNDNHHAFMADATQADFDALVLKQSHTVPVVADFWAAWCGPCKTLMPLLAKLAGEYQGKFFLAKINTDQEQALAARYAIRSLPTVKIFKNGQVVDEFMGAQPERTIRTLLDRHIARPADALIDQALAAQLAGDGTAAEALLQRATQADPSNDRPKLHLAKLLFESGRTDEGEQLLGTLSAAGKNDPEVLSLRARLDFVRVAAASPPLAQLQQAVAAEPRNHEARYQLAARYVVDGAYSQALDELLEIVRRDRKFRDDAARKAMLSVFNILGGQGEVVASYRRLLSMALN